MATLALRLLSSRHIAFISLIATSLVTGTHPTGAPARRSNVQVVATQDMSERTMGFPSVYRDEISTPHGILAGRYGLKMLRINTAPISTKVVKVQTVGNRPVQSLPNKTVCNNTAPTNRNTAVAPSYTPLPFPAGVIPTAPAVTLKKFWKLVEKAARFHNSNITTA